MPLFTPWITWPGSKHFHQSINLIQPQNTPVMSISWDGNSWQYQVIKYLTLPDWISLSRFWGWNRKPSAAWKTSWQVRRCQILLSGETNQLNWVSREDLRPVQFPQAIPIYDHLLVNYKGQRLQYEKKMTLLVSVSSCTEGLKVQKKGKTQKCKLGRRRL